MVMFFIEIRFNDPAKSGMTVRIARKKKGKRNVFS
jgi:hypothetical protein